MGRTLEDVVQDTQQVISCSSRAIDALSQIAAFGGVQGDWAMEALRDIRAMVGETSLLEVTQ